MRQLRWTLAHLVFRQLQLGLLGQAVERYEEILAMMSERDLQRPEMLLRCLPFWWDADEARKLWHDARRLAVEMGPAAYGLSDGRFDTPVE